MKSMRSRSVAAFAAVLIASLALAACGSSGSDSASAKDTDGSFVAGMVPHHQSAIDMARLAQEQGQHPEIKQLANAIVNTQAIEIQQLSAAHQRLFGKSLAEGGTEHGAGLGLDQHLSGMDMEPGVLDGAKPFDREFIDMMIPHHQGAIRMARIEIANGSDAELQQIAQDIITAQTLEIQKMNAWRKSWYGSASPAGGVPALDDTGGDRGSMPGMSGGDSMSGMGH